MKKLIARLLKQEDPSVYQLKDGQLEPTLRTIDLIGLGTGMVVGTAIFTLPGIVAAEHTGPAVPLAFIVAAIGAISRVLYLGCLCRLRLVGLHAGLSRFVWD